MTAKRITCGVVVTDGVWLLLGHATRSPRWDIPKGMAEPGEALVDAACRELREETGLVVAGPFLEPLGIHAYLPGKDLALFVWRPAVLPDPRDLRCNSVVARPGQAPFPELDRFGLFERDAGLALVGKGLARVLTRVWPLISV